MPVEDFFGQLKRWRVRLHEKGDKSMNTLPPESRSLSQRYLHAAGIPDAKKTPVFRCARSRTGDLTRLAIHRIDAWRMIRRRAKSAASMSKTVATHSEWQTVYLDNNCTLENAQALAAHENPRATKLYDRTSDESRSMRSSGSRFDEPGRQPISACRRCTKRTRRRISGGAS
jgi:integrase/recombinase XerD